ncbi:hypothetical protein Plec18167_005682 [Paecilomyces lecythidis]|uniref:Mitochondrial carrier protein n=1 Tax=Paecilomyces lecythidis TaxID=3004212 RepID=A0ABR3XHD9_9EURO
MYNTSTDIWVAGAFAAFTVDFLVYPLDTLKTRIQSPHYERLYKNLATGAINRTVLFRGLYQGIWSVVLATIPSSGAFFTTYEAIKYTLNASSKSNPESSKTNVLPFTHSLPTPVIHSIASSSAELVSCFILTPAEVLKQNAQMVSARGPSSWNQSITLQVLSKFRPNPFRLWSGYTALVARNLPFTGLQFPMFEYLRTHMIEWRRERKGQSATSSANDLLIERAGITSVAAGLAGSVAAVVTTPIDVIKTRIMLSAGDSEEQRRAAVRQNRSRGAWAVGRQVWLEEGMKGLFKGGAIRACWTAVGLGLYLGAYEGGRFYLENRRKEKDIARGKLGLKSEEGEAVI